MKTVFVAGFYPLWMAFNKSQRHRFLEYSRLALNPLPTVTLDSLIPSDYHDSHVLKLKALLTNEHNCSIIEIFSLAIMVKITNARRIFEIGTYDGRSALSMACNQPAWGRLYTLNLPENYLLENPHLACSVDVQLSAKVKSGERFLSQAEKDKIVQWYGDSREFDASSHAPYQIIFIDGGHSFNVIMQDTEKALKLIDTNDGIIFWHDATRFGVGKYLPILLKKGYRIYRIEGTELAFIRFKKGVEVDFDISK